MLGKTVTLRPEALQGAYEVVGFAHGVRSPKGRVDLLGPGGEIIPDVPAEWVREVGWKERLEARG
tara:strand:+ start:1085 stop:1279 length:195 start_codon:yes stop_codon:yes gene_type:complete